MHNAIAHKIASVFPRLQKLNKNEKQVLKAALVAASANGYDMGFVDEIEGLNLSARQIAGYLGDLSKKGFIDAYGSGPQKFSEFAPSREMLAALRTHEAAVYAALDTRATTPRKDEKEKKKLVILETQKLKDGWEAIMTQASEKQNMWYLKGPDKKIRGYIKHVGGANWQVIDKKTGRRVKIYRRMGDAFRYGPSLLSS